MRRRGLLLLALGGMELTYLWAALVFLDVRAAGGHLHLLWTLPLYAVGVGIGWGLGGLRRPLRYSLAATALALALLTETYVQFYAGSPLFDPRWLGSLLAALNPLRAPELPAQGVLLAVGPLLAWRGWALARSRAGEEACMARFQFGAAMFLLVFVAASQMEIEVRSWVPSVFAFTALSLGSMGLARAGGGRGWGTAGRLWSGVLGMTILLVMVSGLVVAAVLTPELLRWPLLALKAAGVLLMKGVDWLMSLLPASQNPELLLGMAEAGAGGAEADVSQAISMPEWLRRLLRGGLAVLWLGMALAAMASVSAQVWGRLRRGLAGETEPLPGAFREDLLSWLRGVWHWLLRTGLRRGGLGGGGPLTSPRQVYRSLLRCGARAGWRRLPAQTPSEYQAALTAVLPSGHDDLGAITAAYLQARYGPRPPTVEEGRHVLEVWRRLRPMLRRRRLSGGASSPNLGKGVLGR